MAVTANTNETYDVTTIREDLSEAMASITPTETIFMSSIVKLLSLMFTISPLLASVTLTLAVVVA